MPGAIFGAYTAQIRVHASTQRGLFDEILAIDGSQGFGYAWDCFLAKVSDREAALENAVMDPATLRAVLERLAHIVRGRTAGTGPITGNDLSDAYMAETQQAAGEGVLAQLQRLPGLTQREQEPGARSFVDEDMLAALQGGALAKIILGQSTFPLIVPLAGISRKAIAMASYLLKMAATTSASVIAVMERQFRQMGERQAEGQFVADCLSLALSMASDEGADAIDCRGITVRGADILEVDLSEVRIDGATIQDCVIGEVHLAQSTLNSNVKFRGCLIGTLTGAANETGAPAGMFDQRCTVETFDSFATNNAVLNSDLPPQTKALVTVLRKLYLQTGSGRKIEALRRGITQGDVAPFIPVVLTLLERHGFISIFNKVVHPVRKQQDRVTRILSAPALSLDPLAKDVLALQV